jgi:hypothetical protein
MVAVSSEAAEAPETYFQAHQVKPDRIVSHAGGPLGTPTMVLVDKKGMVLRVWVGKQPPQGEEEVWRALE